MYLWWSSLSLSFSIRLGQPNDQQKATKKGWQLAKTDQISWIFSRIQWKTLKTWSDNLPIARKCFLELRKNGSTTFSIDSPLAVEARTFVVIKTTGIDRDSTHELVCWRHSCNFLPCDCNDAWSMT